MIDCWAKKTSKQRPVFVAVVWAGRLGHPPNGGGFGVPKNPLGEGSQGGVEPV